MDVDHDTSHYITAVADMGRRVCGFLFYFLASIGALTNNLPIQAAALAW
jgi:hypothetical protein